MKATTLFVLALTGLAGAACSEPSREASDSVPAELASADDAGSKLNLSLPSTDSQTASGGLNLGLPSLEEDGLLIGEDVLETPDLGGEVNVELPDGVTETETPAGEDDLVRLPPAQ